MDDYTISALDGVFDITSDINPFTHDIALELANKMTDSGITDLPADMFPNIIEETVNILAQRSFEKIQVELFEGEIHEYEGVPPYEWEEFKQEGMVSQPDTLSPVEGIDYILEPTNSYRSFL